MKTTTILLRILVLAFLTMSFRSSDDWIAFENESCQMHFPKKPVDQSRTINTEIGKLVVIMHTYDVPPNEQDDNRSYFLAECEYPDSLLNSDRKDILDKLFRIFINGVVRGVHGKLLSEFVIQLDGYPGRETKIDVIDGVAVITMRFYLVRNRMYIIQTFTDTNKDFNQSITKFMDSFKLKK